MTIHLQNYITEMIQGGNCTDRRGTILNARLRRFEHTHTKKKHNVKQACFVGLTILNKIIKVKDELSDT